MMYVNVKLYTRGLLLGSILALSTGLGAIVPVNAQSATISGRVGPFWQKELFFWKPPHC